MSLSPGPPRTFPPNGEALTVSSPSAACPLLLATLGFLCASVTRCDTVAIQHTQSPSKPRESQNTGRQLSLGLLGHTAPTEPALRGELYRGQSNANTCRFLQISAVSRASPEHLPGFQQGRGWVLHGCMLLGGFLRSCTHLVVSRSCSDCDI